MRKKRNRSMGVFLSIILVCSSAGCGGVQNGPVVPESSVAPTTSEEEKPAGTLLLEHGERDVLNVPTINYEGDTIERDWILNKITPDFSYLRNDLNYVENSVEKTTNEKGEPAEMYTSVITNPHTGKSIRKVEQTMEAGYTLSQYFYEDTMFLEDAVTSWNIAWADDNFLLGSSLFWTFYYDIQHDVLEYICYPFTERIPKISTNAINYELFSQMDIPSSSLVTMDFARQQLVTYISSAEDPTDNALVFYDWKTGEDFEFHKNITMPENGNGISTFAYFTGDSLYYSVRQDASNNGVSLYKLDIPSRKTEVYMTTGDETAFLGGSRYVAFNRFFTVRNEDQYLPQELDKPQEFIVHDLETGENVFRVEGSYTATLYNRYVLYVKDGAFYAFDLEERQLYNFNTEKLFEQYPGQEIIFNTIVNIGEDSYMPDFPQMLGDPSRK